jgi:hypothetical protein
MDEQQGSELCLPHRVIQWCQGRHARRRGCAGGEERGNVKALADLTNLFLNRHLSQQLVGTTDRFLFRFSGIGNRRGALQCEAERDTCQQ